MKKLVLVFIVVLVGLSVVIGFSQKEAAPKQPETSIVPSPAQIFIEKPTMAPTKSPVVSRASIYEKIELNVPFVIQAPRHNWKDLDFQNACEEAAIIMAMHWIDGSTISSEEAYLEIKTLSDFSQKTYGFHLDQTASDVARLIKDYYKYEKIRYTEDIGVIDIKTELSRGNLVIVPVNGQKLNNPFFTQPGPLEHMLVVKGYDPKTKEFITNDAGIGKGNGYRYPENTLEKSLQNYPTGYHEPITRVEKVMIVVEK